MAYEEGSISSQEKGPKPIVYALDERRRAALAEVDNAKFSYVTPLQAPKFGDSLFFSGGSTPRSVSSLVSVSSPMRE